MDPADEHSLRQFTRDGKERASRNLGSILLRAVDKVNDLHGGPAVQSAGFAVLKSPSIPSALLETAFISNPEEERKLRSEKFRGEMAKAVADALQQYGDPLSCCGVGAAMSARIVELPPSVSGRIAAGEVIERPAAALKELIENALDAGAGAVDIVLEKGGVGLMEARDNGAGIAAEDLPLAFRRHATSKTQSAEDLNAIKNAGLSRRGAGEFGGGGANGNRLPRGVGVARLVVFPRRRQPARAGCRAAGDER